MTSSASSSSSSAPGAAASSSPGTALPPQPHGASSGPASRAAAAAGAAMSAAPSSAASSGGAGGAASSSPLSDGERLLANLRQNMQRQSASPAHASASAAAAAPPPSSSASSSSAAAAALNGFSPNWAEGFFSPSAMQPAPAHAGSRIFNRPTSSPAAAAASSGPAAAPRPSSSASSSSPAASSAQGAAPTAAPEPANRPFSIFRPSTWGRSERPRATDIRAEYENKVTEATGNVKEAQTNIKKAQQGLLSITKIKDEKRAQRIQAEINLRTLNMQLAGENPKTELAKALVEQIKQTRERITNAEDEILTASRSEEDAKELLQNNQAKLSKAEKALNKAKSQRDLMKSPEELNGEIASQSAEVRDADAELKRAKNELEQAKTSEEKAQKKLLTAFQNRSATTDLQKQFADAKVAKEQAMQTVANAEEKLEKANGELNRLQDVMSEMSSSRPQRTEAPKFRPPEKTRKAERAERDAQRATAKKGGHPRRVHSSESESSSSSEDLGMGNLYEANEKGSRSAGHPRRVRFAADTSSSSSESEEISDYFSEFDEEAYQSHLRMRMVPAANPPKGKGKARAAESDSEDSVSGSDDDFYDAEEAPNVRITATQGRKNCTVIDATLVCISDAEIKKMETARGTPYTPAEKTALIEQYTYQVHADIPLTAETKGSPEECRKLYMRCLSSVFRKIKERAEAEKATGKDVVELGVTKKFVIDVYSDKISILKDKGGDPLVLDGPEEANYAAGLSRGDTDKLLDAVTQEAAGLTPEQLREQLYPLTQNSSLPGSGRAAEALANPDAAEAPSEDEAEAPRANPAAARKPTDHPFERTGLSPRCYVAEKKNRLHEGSEIGQSAAHFYIEAEDDEQMMLTNQKGWSALVVPTDINAAKEIEAPSIKTPLLKGIYNKVKPALMNTYQNNTNRARQSRWNWKKIFEKGEAVVAADKAALGTQKIIYAISPEIGADNTQTKRNIREAVKNLLKTAIEAGLKTIPLPLLGTETGLTNSDLYEANRSGIHEFAEERRKKGENLDGVHIKLVLNGEQKKALANRIHTDYLENKHTVKIEESERATKVEKKLADAIKKAHDARNEVLVIEAPAPTSRNLSLFKPLLEKIREAPAGDPLEIRVMIPDNDIHLEFAPASDPERDEFTPIPVTAGTVKADLEKFLVPDGERRISIELVGDKPEILLAEIVQALEEFNKPGRGELSFDKVKILV